MADELRAELHDPRAVTAPPGWDECVGAGSVHPTWHWSVLRAASRDLPGRMHALSLRDGARLVGTATVWQRGGRGRWPYPGLLDVRCVGAAALPGIALAGQVPGTPGLAPFDPDLFGAAVRAVESTLRAHFSRRVPVLYRQVYAEMLPVVLRGTSVAFPDAPVTVLRNTFASYDGYLATLAKSRRGDQRRLVRRFDDDPTVTVEWGVAPADLDYAAMKRLADETARRNGPSRRRGPTFPLGLRRALIQAPDSWLLRYTGADGTLGWGMTYDHPTVPVAGPWGALDPRRGGRSGIWFDQMARVARWMIESGRAGIIGGKGLADLKGELGYQAVPQWTVLVRSRGRS